jgi:hypothetical protein
MSVLYFKIHLALEWAKHVFGLILTVSGKSLLLPGLSRKKFEIYLNETHRALRSTILIFVSRFFVISDLNSRNSQNFDKIAIKIIFVGL